MEKSKSDLEKLSNTFSELFPKLTHQQQNIDLKLYRLLSEGSPVSSEALSKAIGLSEEAVKTTLKEWYGVYYDECGEVIGFWGLAVPEMNHRFMIDGKTLYTWCAWDSLFIPELIQKTAQIESICPVSGNKICLTVSPIQIEKFEPTGAVMSLLIPEAAKIRQNVIMNFCHYVHFFYSSDLGHEWISQNERTFLLSIHDAFSLGHMKNKGRFNKVIKK
jgi:alkylmercury lyase